MEHEIKDMVINHVVTRLQERLIEQVNDDTAGSVVRAGKLQQNPTRDTGINVLVWEADDEDGGDELWTKNFDRHSGIHSPSYEIGGGAFFYRRLHIYMLFHFKGLRGDDGRQEARKRAQVILARIKHLLLRMNQERDFPLHPETGQPTDDFSETILAYQVDRHFIREGGGSGDFIWKGEVFFGIHTEQLTLE